MPAISVFLLLSFACLNNEERVIISLVTRLLLRFVPTRTKQFFFQSGIRLTTNLANTRISQKYFLFTYFRRQRLLELEGDLYFVLLVSRLPLFNHFLLTASWIDFLFENLSAKCCWRKTDIFEKEKKSWKNIYMEATRWKKTTFDV